MTKKDYIALAEIISANTSHTEDLTDLLPTYILLKRDFVIALCSYLEADNPLFDKVKFMDAIYK